MSNFSHLANANPRYIENMYRQFTEQPESVDQSWQDFFLGFDYASKNGNGTVSTEGTSLPQTEEGAIDWGHVKKEINVFSLIKAYRVRAHVEAEIDPINEFNEPGATLNLEDYGLIRSDLDTVFKAAEEIDLPPSSLRDIIAQLDYIYLNAIGFECDHIFSREKRRWLRDRIEKRATRASYGLSQKDKEHILKRLTDAVTFEEFLRAKYGPTKRFGLEGGEAAIVSLDAIINQAAEEGVEEVLIGMAHRGRLNTLVNIMDKSLESIFQEFEGAVPKDITGDGDVKYHMGYRGSLETQAGRTVKVELAPNPSHLEAVGPVVEGFARAKADMYYNNEDGVGNDYDKILPILIHGDAAVAGQGVVFETAQMSELEAYTTGGTIHFIINNQVGFTTDQKDARTSIYSSGVASVTQSPVFHVNGEDPEAVMFVSRLAMEYRNRWNSDVYIDMLCYRKNGHNEGDDPNFTQPGMYDKIKEHDDVREIYARTLAERGEFLQADADKMHKDLRAKMQEIHDQVKSVPSGEMDYRYQPLEGEWDGMDRDHWKMKFFEQSPETGVDKKTLDKVLSHLTTLPKDFDYVKKMERLYKGYKKAVDNDQLDWALGELSAYATLLLEGHGIRMSGQDVRRGTFSHRHAILNSNDGKSILNRLDGLSEDQGKLLIYNSLLSEFAVLGFEYGYATASPNNLVLWEAQFGDFANGAMTMFDQFISSGESKWAKMNGLTIMLPHGYEGMGPEHSSARLERFLQLCAEYNMIVTNITMPANLFHALRRQMAWNFRKPMVNMSPKAGLRHPMATSPVADFGPGTRFQEILDDPTVSARGNKKVKRLLLCSGKVYFDLAQYKEKNQRDDVAIVRIEQLFPLPTGQVQKLLKRYAGAEVVWVQEESRNAGAWIYISEQFLYNEAIDTKLRYVGRTATASPATGYKTVHVAEQEKLVKQAFE